MGIVFDIVLIGIIIISTFIGYKRGLVNVVFNLCAFLIALIITICLYTPITNLVLENTEFDEKIENIIIEKGVNNDVENSTEIPFLDNYVSQSITEAKNDIVKSTSTIISQKIIGAVVAIILFIVVRIVLIFAKALINGIASLPIIKQFNEIGGLIYGIVIGLVIVYLLLAVFYFVVSVNNNGTIANAINSSFITKILYNNNLILNIIF